MYTLWFQEIVGELANTEFLISKDKIWSGYFKIWRHNWLMLFRKNNINDDLKRGIYGCFLWAYGIDTFVFALLTMANMFYGTLYFSFQEDFGFRIPWIGILYINLLYFFFFIRYLRDIYKISLRGKYRRNYSKLWWVDLITLNLLSLLGTWLFLRDKTQVDHHVKTDVKFIGDLGSYINISRFYKFVSKIELAIFAILAALLFGSLAISFINVESSDGIKWIFLIVYAWVVLDLSFSLQRSFALVILKGVLKDFAANQSEDLLMTSIRLLSYIFGYVYVSVFINILCRDETTKNLIFEQW